MNTKIPITIAGNLVADPELTIGESGTPHAKLRVAVNQRIQNPDGTWRDGEPVFHNVSAFRMLAENASTSLKKGDPVTVSGNLSSVPTTKTVNDVKQGASSLTPLGRTFALARRRINAPREQLPSPRPPWRPQGHKRRRRLAGPHTT